MTHTPIKVLLVEDDPQDAVMVRALLRSALTTAGLDFRHAEGVVGVLDTIGTFQPDVVLIDYNLPDGNGIDLLVKIGKQYPGLPCVMVTGKGNEKVAVLALQEGAQDYLPKAQLDAPALVRSIFRALALARFDESRQRTELENQRLRSQMQGLMGLHPDPVLLLDARGGITLANQAALDSLDWPHNHVAGKDFHDLAHRLQPTDVHHDAHSCALLTAMDGDATATLENQFLCTGAGEFLAAGITLTPLVVANAFAGWIVTLAMQDQAQARTPAQRQHAERVRRLRLEDQERTDMLNVIGHLIQTHDAHDSQNCHVAWPRVGVALPSAARGNRHD